MTDITTVYVVLVAIVVLMASNRMPVGLVALGGAITLWAVGVLTHEQIYSGFGDPIVIMIAALFVVSEALDVTGVTAWAGRHVMRLAGDSPTKLLLFTMTLSALLTALISVNGAVAALVPMAVLVSTRISHPSQLLMPLAFAAHAGSMLALTGTPVNILVADELMEQTGVSFGFFEFTLVGIPLVIGTMLLIVVLAPRVLPRPKDTKRLPDFSMHGATIARHYYGRGAEEKLKRTAATLGMEPDVTPAPDELADLLINREHGVAEVIVHPRSGMIGEEVYPGMITDSGELVVLAVQRNGMSCGTSRTKLIAGDLLLLHGTWGAIEQNVDDPDVVVVDEPLDVRRQAVPLGTGSTRAIAVLVAMVVLLTFGVMPAAVTALLAACAMIIFGVISVEGAYRGISWATIVLMGGMLPVSRAVEQSGAADELASWLIDVVGNAGPHALLIGIFLFTAVLGQLISNMATALIIIPVSVSAAVEMGVAVEPVLMTVTIAAAAALLTPVATPANMMVQLPGGYRFGDYWKLGLPLLAWYFVIAIFVVPIFWSL